jgi:sialic acid synthase SpsE
VPHDVSKLTIGGRAISPVVPPFVIAEIGINHGGSLAKALALVEAAAEAGAHAVKLQTIVAHDLVSPVCPAPAHVRAESMVEFFSQFELDEDAHRAVADHARSRGLRVLSTPFSETAVEVLERVGVDGFKIASGDLTWDQLIARCAATRKPVVISTGMATLGEARHAVEIARAAGAAGVALLHCVSAYPVPLGSENLRAIAALQSCGVPVGLSDHGTDTFAYPLAVALGSCLYERHIRLDGDESAPDAAVSSTSHELAAAIANGRRAWAALGSGSKACLEAESVNVIASRRSLCAAKDLTAGAVVGSSDLVALRPGTGYPPSAWPLICGRRLARPLRRGEPFAPSHFETDYLESHRVA